MKFTRTKFTTLDGSTKVRFDLDHGDTPKEEQVEFYMDATRSGIEFKGHLKMKTMDDLQKFASQIDKVWRDHLSLKKGGQIVSTLAGH